MASIVEIEFECCGSTYSLPTAIPENGSILHHTSAVGTVEMILEVIHTEQHPECEGAAP